jgi:hypothetical protein
VTFGRVLPCRKNSSSHGPAHRDIYSQPLDEEPGDPVGPAETQPAAPQVPDPEPVPEPAPKLANDPSSLNLDRNQPTVANPFINPVMLNRVPDASDYGVP